MIGGEFQIAISDVSTECAMNPSLSDVYVYSSGRAALYQILRFIQREKLVRRILIPDYLCSSVLYPIKALGLDYEFYHINNNLIIDRNSFYELYRKDDAILIINYFGLQDISDSVSFIREIANNAIIIEDDVQAYYEFKKPLDRVDFKFTSLRKTFAVPDGGLVKTRCDLPKIQEPNTFGQYKAAAALLKFIREGNFSDNIYLELFEKGESMIDSELDRGMSSIALKIISRLDEEFVKLRRISNAGYLVNELQRIGIRTILPFSNDKVPLFIPIYIENRDEVRKRMFKHEVFCPVHWPLDGMKIKRGAELEQHELSLIVDQRYEQKDLDLILSLL